MAAQRGQVFEQASRSAADTPLWGYRYRMAGRASRRLQVGGDDGAARWHLDL